MLCRLHFQGTVQSYGAELEKYAVPIVGGQANLQNAENEGLGAGGQFFGDGFGEGAEGNEGDGGPGGEHFVIDEFGLVPDRVLKDLLPHALDSLQEGAASSSAIDEFGLVPDRVLKDLLPHALDSLHEGAASSSTADGLAVKIYDIVKDPIRKLISSRESVETADRLAEPIAELVAKTVNDFFLKSNIS